MLIGDPNLGFFPPKKFNLPEGSIFATKNSAALETYFSGHFFKPGGSKLYTVGTSADVIREFNLSTPWDVTTASASGATIACQDSQTHGLFFNDSGTKAYILGGSNRRVYQYNLTTPWVLSSAVYASIYLVITAITTLTRGGLFFSPDGTKLFLGSSTPKTISMYVLPTAWVLTGGVLTATKDVTAQVSTYVRGILFDKTGTKLFISSDDGYLYSYTLSSAWDITTAVYDSVRTYPYEVGTYVYNPTLKTDEKSLFVSNANDYKLYEYLL